VLFAPVGASALCCSPLRSRLVLCLRQGRSAAAVPGERGGRGRFAGKAPRGRGGRGRGGGSGAGGGGVTDEGLARLNIYVDAQGIATVAVRVLPRRWRETVARADRPEKVEKSAEEREKEREEREARKLFAVYAQTRALALAQVVKGDGGINVNKALGAATKFVMQAQRVIDTKSEQMQQMDLASEGEDAAMHEAVKLCAACVEINKEVREVLTGILWRKEADELNIKEQEKLLELLMLSQEWSKAFDASDLPLPAWLSEPASSAKDKLRTSTTRSLQQSVVTAEVKQRRKDLVDFLTNFVTKFFQKNGCGCVRIAMFGSIAAHIDTPSSDIDLLLKIEGKVSMHRRIDR
jgi:hypothetical protein